jgi:hypothetical protein
LLPRVVINMSNYPAVCLTMRCNRRPCGATAEGYLLIAMNEFPKNLGEPDIELSGLEIWVHGRQFPDSSDYWDGNWINITAKCTSKNACVWVSGNIMHLPDLKHFMTTSEKLYKNLKGEAKLPCIEPELSVVLKASSLGQIIMTVDITPDHLNQEHKFEFEIDQSYLPGLISSCKKVLKRYRIKGEA